jgi:hypothetical protein
VVFFLICIKALTLTSPLFFVLEFGVSIKNHRDGESSLYHVENNETDESRRQQHVLTVPASTLGCNSNHIQRSVVQKAVAVSQTDKKADVPNVAPFCECPESSQYLKQMNIEEHQNKENENPEAQSVNYCNGCTLAVRNEQRKAANLDSRTDIPNHACSALLLNAVNDAKGTSFSQRVRVRMGTKAFSDVLKESFSSYQKTCDTASTILSGTSKRSSLQNACVLSKYICIFSVYLPSVFPLCQ